MTPLATSTMVIMSLNNTVVSRRRNCFYNLRVFIYLFSFKLVFIAVMTVAYCIGRTQWWKGNNSAGIESCRPAVIVVVVAVVAFSQCSEGGVPVRRYAS